MILSAQRMQYFQGKPEYLSKIIIHLHQVWFPLKKWVPFYNPWKNPTNLCKLSKKDTVKLLEPIINLCWWVWEKQNFCLDSANSKSVLKTINAKSNFCYELRQAIAKSDTRTFSEWRSFFQRSFFVFSKVVLDLILSNLVLKMDFLMKIQQATSFLQRISFPKIAFFVQSVNHRIQASCCVSSRLNVRAVRVYFWGGRPAFLSKANYLTQNLDKDPERMAYDNLCAAPCNCKYLLPRKKKLTWQWKIYHQWRCTVFPLEK